jgi:hypothetical protein
MTEAGRPEIIPENEFDEEFYLKQYPDVAAAVKRGGYKSGYQHYAEIGLSRGRLASTKQLTLRYPVFLVGSPRSGTSILVDSLLSAGYNGYREGMFLSLAHHIDRLIDHHFSAFLGDKNLISAIDKNRLKDSIFAILKQTEDARNPVAPWFDKTGNPDMIYSIPILLKLWPDSVFIFAKRRAIENVLSRLKKFPQNNFEYHCSDWANNMRAWREIRTDLPSSKYLEVDQQSLIEDPAQASERIGCLLRLSADQKKAMVETFRSNRPQQTEKGSAERLHTLETAGFNEQQTAAFLKHCRAEMEEFGYSLDETYRRSPSQKSATAT